MNNQPKDKEIRREICTAAAGLHIRETEGNSSRAIAGYAILFNTPSVPLWEDENGEAREVIASSAISKELLDSSDIKFTMFHNREILLARSNKGRGSLRYSIDDKGVAFEFDAPNTVEGDKALEAIRRGDIAGCSFAFTTRYWDSAFVERSVETVGNSVQTTYTVKVITGVYDMTLAADPAYPDTEVETRELISSLREAEGVPEEPVKPNGIAELRELAKEKFEF